MRPVLSVQNLNVHFGDRHILSNISFHILPNQILVLMGPGGAGKSTILRSICAINADQPHARFAGKVTYLGKPILQEHAPAMVLQKAHLLLGTVFENIRDQSPLRGQLSPLELRLHIIEFLQSFDLHELIEHLDTAVLNLSAVQRKQVMIAAALCENPALLCLDEPTADLSDDEAQEILALIRKISEKHALLVITHNQKHARAIGDSIALIAGGRIQELAPIDDFFSSPQSQPARDYVRTGGCSVPSLNAKPEDLEPDYTELFQQKPEPIDDFADNYDERPPFIELEVSDLLLDSITEPGLITDSVPLDDSAVSKNRILPFGWIRQQNKQSTQPLDPDRITTDDITSNAEILNAVKVAFSTQKKSTPPNPPQHERSQHPASASRGPRNFHWLRDGVLAGTPKPGLLVDITEDFQALKRVGITHLITLTEEPLTNAPLHDFDIENIHFPIIDMEAPTIEMAAELCERIAKLIEQGKTIAYHCHAGIGRTGTMLVAQLIWEGMDDKTALKTARLRYSAWVQSKTQEEFLADFYLFVDANDSKTARLSPKTMTSSSS